MTNNNNKWSVIDHIWIYRLVFVTTYEEKVIFSEFDGIFLNGTFAIIFLVFSFF